MERSLHAPVLSRGLTGLRPFQSAAVLIVHRADCSERVEMFVVGLSRGISWICGSEWNVGCCSVWTAHEGRLNCGDAILIPVCVRARVFISQAESLATLSYEVAAVASISKLELSGVIFTTLSAIHVGSLDLTGWEPASLLITPYRKEESKLLCILLTYVMTTVLPILTKFCSCTAVWERQHWIF